MARRVIVAVIAGYVTNAVVITATEQMLSKLVPARGYFAADVFTQCVIQIGCGYLCSWIADPRQLIATVVLIIVGLVIGSVSVLATWRSEPHWYAVVLLCVYAPCVWVGHLLERRRRINTLT